MKIINHTPHAITVCADNCNHTFEPKGEPIRLEHEQFCVGRINKIPIFVNKLMGHNLPDEKADTLLLVSTMILQAFPERSDLISPDTGRTALRNDRGHIVSVRGFVRNKGAKSEIEIVEQTTIQQVDTSAKGTEIPAPDGYTRHMIRENGEETTAGDIPQVNLDDLDG